MSGATTPPQGITWRLPGAPRLRPPESPLLRAIRASNEKFPFAGLAKQYGVSSDTIRWIKKGRYYKSVA